MRLSLLVAVALSACANAGGGARTDASAATAWRRRRRRARRIHVLALPCSILPQCGCIATYACDVDTTDATAPRAGRSPRRARTRTRATRSTTATTATCASAARRRRRARSTARRTRLRFATRQVRHRYHERRHAGAGHPAGVLVELRSNGHDRRAVPPDVQVRFVHGDARARHGSDHGLHARRRGHAGRELQAGTVGNEALCAKGFLCTTTDSGGTFSCRKVCNTPGTTSAACGGQACIMFNPTFTVGPDSYGVCAP